MATHFVGRAQYRNSTLVTLYHVSRNSAVILYLVNISYILIIKFYYILPHRRSFKPIAMSTTTPFPSFTKTWHNSSYAAINPSRPELSAKGRNVVITGGGAGIGARAVRSFVEARASSIGIIGRTEESLTEIKQSFEQDFPDVKIYTSVTDITIKTDVDKAFSGFVACAGQLHILVNNAGYGGKDPLIKDVEPDRWMRSIQVNVKGSLIVAAAFVRCAAPDAVVINLSSSLSYMLAPNYSSYAVPKAAAVTLFDLLQIENPTLRVVNIHPGIIDTAMTRRAGSSAMDQGELIIPSLTWYVYVVLTKRF